MTTDKIRAAAQMLLEAHDSIAPLREMSSGWDQLRAALAEPAQAAPAGDAVPVVAIAACSATSAFMSLMATRKDLLCDDDREDQTARHETLLVRQSDHLAAMEALRADLGRLYGVLADELRQSRDENERLKADRSAQVAEVMRLVDLVAESQRHDTLESERGGTGPTIGPDEAIRMVESAVRKLAGGA